MRCITEWLETGLSRTAERPFGGKIWFNDRLALVLALVHMVHKISAACATAAGDVTWLINIPGGLKVYHLSTSSTF